MALVLAGLSVLYTHRQAVAAAETARIERARRHGERQPQLQVGLRPLKGHDSERRFLRLIVRLDGPESLTAVRVEIRDASGLIFTAGQHGVKANNSYPVTTGQQAAPAGEDLLVPGDHLTWQLEVDRREPCRPSKARLLIHGFKGDEAWLVQHEVRVPPGKIAIVSSR